MSATKRARKKIAKKSGKSQETMFIAVDKDDNSVIAMAKTKHAIEEAIAFKMNDNDLEEDYAASYFVVYEVCRQFSVRPEADWSIYLTDDKLDID